MIHHGKERSRAKKCAWRAWPPSSSAPSPSRSPSLLGPTANVAFLVGLAFAVAASANLPVIVFSIFWKRFNTAGAVVGIATGLLSFARADRDQPQHHGLIDSARHLIQASRSSR